MRFIWEKEDIDGYSDGRCGRLVRARGSKEVWLTAVRADHHGIGKPAFALVSLRDGLITGDFNDTVEQFVERLNKGQFEPLIALQMAEQQLTERYALTPKA